MKKVHFKALLQVLLSLGLGKLLATFLTLHDFGTYSILLGILALVGAIAIQPNAQYVKYLYSKKSPHLELPIGRLEIVILGFFLLSTLLALPYMGETVVLSGIFCVYIVLNGAFGIKLDLVNVKFGVSQYFNLSLLRLGITLFLVAILFGMLKRTSLLDVLFVQALSLVLALFFESRILDRVNVSLRVVNRDESVAKRSFAQPLLFSGVLLWSMNSMDRIVLGCIESNEIVALYSANLSLGAKMPSLVYPIIIASLTKNLFTNEESFRRWWKLRYAGVLCGVLFIGLGSLALWCLRFQICSLMLAPHYGSHSWLMPVGFASGTLLALSFIAETFFFVRGKTKLVLYSNVLLFACASGAYLFFWLSHSFSGLAFGTLVAPTMKLTFLLRQKI